MSTILYLVRHGETEWNKLNRFQGRTDIPLSETGIWQAKQTKDRLSFQFDVVYTSPLSRCVQTAEIITSDTDVEIFQNDDLIEIDFGAWEGFSLDEIINKYPKEYELWKTDEETSPIIGGEQSMKNASIRGKNVLMDIVNKNKGKRVLVIAHGGIIRASLIGIYDFNINMYHNIQLLNTSITTVEFFDDQKPTIIGVNDVGHLNIN